MPGLMVVAVLAVAGFVGYLVFMAPGSQLFGPYPYRGDSDDRVIALTFDDGPNEPYTSQIAQVLESRGIKGTFFQVGRCVQRHPQTTTRLYEAGHIIGNHSATHRFHTYLVPGRFQQEVEVTQTILTELLGRTPALARTPWLWRTPTVLRTLRRRALFAVAGVFAHAGEVFQPNGDRIARRAIARARPGGVIIFHDGFDGRGGNRAETVRAVEQTADALLAQGYRFVTIDELFGVAAYQP
jgi:peptidoglycan-N-acetylglucosamine deacetylase